MKFQPLQLGRRPEPSSHQDWRFEIKYDGFRALAQIEHRRCKLVSRNGNEFKSFRHVNGGGRKVSAHSTAGNIIIQ